ncbi:MAG: matrixin family metalloprotease [Acidobacteria bacterium]|nr:matrixin family metalloprotease [Acidobacteriota bacterium]
MLYACGGGTPVPPVGPSPPPAPPAPPQNSWSIAGTIVTTSARQPVVDARIAPAWDLPAVSTNGAGAFELSSTTMPPTNPYQVTVTGNGNVSREVWLTWQRGPRTEVALDIIRDAPPFSMTYYRQLVRGVFDQPGAPYPVLRWTTAPRFYLKVVDQNGRPIEPEVLAVVRDALHRSVQSYTGGKLAIAALETGTETRPAETGWIYVTITRDPNERRQCGSARIGANPGSITLINDICSCGSNKIPGALVAHEVGHALGFFHVDDRQSVMYPFIPGNCPSGTLSAAEAYHAAIAYSRPRGNLDPDRDPSNGPQLTPGVEPWAYR